MENKNMFAVYSLDNMLDDGFKFHGVTPRNWLAREAIEKLSVKYMDELTDRGIKTTVEWGRNETSVTISHGLHRRMWFFKPIIIGEIKP